jgi:hypothetical protein
MTILKCLAGLTALAMEKGIYGTDMDTDSHTELGWLRLSVFCSVHGESVLEYITEVAASEVIPWQMDG